MFSYISSTNDLTLSNPEEISKGQDLSTNVDDSVGRLTFSGGIGDSHGRVVTDESHGISGGTEGDALDPACEETC